MTDRARRVLVVDDSALVRRWVRHVLEPAGFAIEEALNGIEALEKALGGGFDLIVVDVNMPRMDGMTFLRSLRRQPLPVGGTPALVASTENGPQDREAARRAGANFYLVKPLDEEILRSHVAALAGAPAWTP
ncbi:response regulator [Rubellimicrobium rubrum]|uniref:Response regulator n=1 Tax=Rubellimicrobium rubrum TaxID=2585369 RepID=A0A5C4MMJ8_9RHOB|nr:response regulator [Rubellimicrobium rubrum]TNC46227.1 response regulator [Rubellimicrobium rubrum]